MSVRTGKGNSESLDSWVFNLSERESGHRRATRRLELFMGCLFFSEVSLEASRGGECLLLIVPNRFCGSVTNKDVFGGCLTP